MAAVKSVLFLPVIRGAAAVVALLAAASSLAGQDISYGPDATLGDGTVRTYLVRGAEGTVAELGIAISETAMATLPDLADKGPHEAFLNIDLALPEGTPSPYRFAMFGWNPRGHEPPGIYTVPHFDFHFYFVDPEVRNAIMPGEADKPNEMGTFAGTPFDERGKQAPETGFLPAHYVNPGGTSVPMMGSHWIDPASHEFHGQPFDKTVLYGTWEGKVLFVEPMITKAFIESKPEGAYEIALPEKGPVPGWYPSSYQVKYDADAKEYRIALAGFQER